MILPFCPGSKEVGTDCVVEQTEHPHFQQQSLLVVATCYQDQPNALIQQLHRTLESVPAHLPEQPYQETRRWTAAEIERW